MFLAYVAGAGTDKLMEFSLMVWVNLAAMFSIDISDYIFGASEFIPHFSEENTESESWI